jgi:Protein of unknown function (DUF3060)
MSVGSRRSGVLGRAWLAALLAAPVAAAAGDIVVDGSDQHRTYDCAGGSVILNGGDNVLTLKNCAKVVINSADNQVDAGTAASITVDGSGNKVTYTEVPGRGRPKLVNMGTGNVISSSTGAVVKESASDSEDVEAALEGGAVHVLRDGKGQVTVSPDGTVRVEGSKGGTVELSDRGITARSAKDVVVRENNRTENLDCAGGSASVDGNSSVLTLRACHKVTVSGNGNKLEIVGASSISLLGNANEVGWSPGPDGVAAKISDVGKQNVVTRRP